MSTPPRLRMVRFLPALLLGLPLAGLAQEPPTVIEHVNVIPMDTERVLPNQSVVVHDGRIVCMGAPSTVHVPADVVRVNGEGMYLLPGLFDMHIHLNPPERDEHLALYLRHGVTTTQSMHGTPRHLDVRRRLRRGELLGPRLFTTGPTTATERVNTPEKAEQVVRDQKVAGYDAIKMYGDGTNSMTRETYDRVIAVAHSMGLRVVGHAPRNLPFSAVLEEQQDSIDHMEEIVYTYRPFLEVLKPLIDLQFGRTKAEDVADALKNLDPIPSQLRDAVKKLAQDVKHAGLVVTPTLVAFETIHRQTTDEYPQLLEADAMAYMSPVTRLNWGPQRNRYRSGGWAQKLDTISKILKLSLELQKTLVKAFHDAGVPILVGTDAPLPFVFPGSSVHRELSLLVESGLTPYQALYAGTVAPSIVLAIDAKVGTVAVGKEADLVLVAANPLEDISHASRVKGVFARGRWHPQEALQDSIARLARTYEPLAKVLPTITHLIDDGKPEEAVSLYSELKSDGEAVAPFLESAINTFGYAVLAKKHFQRAIEIFELNTRTFPAAFNTWDSLGEAVMLKGDDDAAAIRYYQRSLELNAKNSNAETMIQRIKDRQQGHD